MQSLPFTTIEGTPVEIGEALGRLAKPAFHAYLAKSGVWKDLQRWRGHESVRQIAESTKQAFPDCWAELHGMSIGLDMDLDDVLLWNCRTDLVRSAFDASATIAVNRFANRFVVHKVHGDPLLTSQCHLIRVRAENDAEFVSLYSPGSIPGHTFAATRYGLVQTVNTLYAAQANAGVGSMFLSRAVLNARSYSEAIDTIMRYPCAGGVHYVLAWAGEFMMLSVETIGKSRSIAPIPNKFGHANHAIRQKPAAAAVDDQALMRSSLERQALVDRLLKLLPDYPEQEDLWTILDPEYGEELGYFGNARHDPSDEGGLVSVFLRCNSNQILLQFLGAQDTAPLEHLIFVK